MIMYETNPDRSEQYKDATPQKLLEQLNENWRQLRLFKTAIDDRDRNLDRLHHSISERDETIEGLQKALRLRNRLWPIVYSVLGGVGTGIVGIIAAIVAARMGK